MQVQKDEPVTEPGVARRSRGTSDTVADHMLVHDEVDEHISIKQETTLAMPIILHDTSVRFKSKNIRDPNAM